MTAPPTHAAAGEPGVDSNTEWIVARIDRSHYRTDLRMGGFELLADEPVSVGGTGAGPTAYEFLLAALGSCTAITLRMYADRKQWPLEGVVVRLRDTPSHIKDCEDCETSAVGPRRIDRVVELKGQLTDEQRKRLMQIADRCPVKQTLERGIQIRNVE